MIVSRVSRLSNRRELVDSTRDGWRKVRTGTDRAEDRAPGFFAPACQRHTPPLRMTRPCFGPLRCVPSWRLRPLSSNRPSRPHPIFFFSSPGCRGGPCRGRGARAPHTIRSSQTGGYSSESPAACESCGPKATPRFDARTKSISSTTSGARSPAFSTRSIASFRFCRVPNSSVNAWRSA